MPPRRSSFPAALPIVALLAMPARADDPVDFARDVRPILARSCASCHGGTSQKGGLRLDRKDRAETGGDTGPVIVAGKPEESPLYRYVAGLEADHVMPPRKARVPRPTKDEIGRIRAWIEQGAKWPDDVTVADASAEAQHWAFQVPKRPDVPAVGGPSWVKNPIDNFVLARLEKEGLRPSPEADRVTLIRRLSLDLIGLPPTVAEVHDFVSDTRPDAYERLVDRLLASPHYGERWARKWLDKARYADTNGYEKDRERSVWPYRDWVVRALNDDMPFDQFTVKQIAGDMLPNATPDDVIATGFHRNTMRNEEGGIDVEEFRYAALVDRVATTGATWLGLTIQCAQCHTHKYDPIAHKEYYQFLACFNNADEPEEYAIPDPAVAAKRSEIGREVERRTAALADAFPPDDVDAGWAVARPVEAKSARGASLQINPDGVVSASGTNPETDVTTLLLDAPHGELAALRIDAIAAPEARERFGPGRTPHGNFVITGVSLEALDAEGRARPLPIASATADVTQHEFDPSGVLDDNPRTGWAIDDGSGRLDRTRSLTLALGERPDLGRGSRLRLTIRQEYGGNHTLGRFRVRTRADAPGVNARPVAERRRANLEAKLSAWQESLKPHCWTIVTPEQAVSHKNATMTVQDDGAVLVTGDKPNNDVYDVVVATKAPRITAIRLEALTDPSLPENGPGRAPLYSVGDFILTEFVGKAIGAGGERPLQFAHASEDYAEREHTAHKAIDGIPESGWTIKGATGKPHAAVFELAEPIEAGPGGVKLALTLHQFGIHNTTLGKFRISVTGDPAPVRASGVPAEVEAAALVPASERSAEQAADLRAHFLSIAPELAPERAKIDALCRSMPKFPTTLVMQERLPQHRRTTNIHRRGEFLNLGEPVEPGLPEFLPRPAGPVRDRLGLARWLVAPENPLTARVTANGIWLAFFGRGLVATPEDFGTRGETPSHPELLDWLACEFPAQGWSQKAMHRLIVTSATYRQGSRATPESLARDPKNILLARGARFRVEAETVRDIALSASGLLNPKLGGPSVYPPQPEGVTSLAYGQAAWPTSTGPDRYRRGLYTFAKRAAPFAAFSLMDAPSPEVACVRRERSNTPLQALTLLNDAAFLEAAQALAARSAKEAPGSPPERARFLFLACLSRAPQPDELAMLTKFYEGNLARFRDGRSDPAPLVASGTPGDRAEAATWTLVARAVLNLDETITRE